MAQRSPVPIEDAIAADCDDFDRLLQEMDCIEKLLNDDVDDHDLRLECGQGRMHADAALNSAKVYSEPTNEYTGTDTQQTHRQLQDKSMNTASVFDELLGKISGIPSELINAVFTVAPPTCLNEKNTPHLAAGAITYSSSATTSTTSTKTKTTKTTKTGTLNQPKRKRTPGYCHICQRSFNDSYNLRVHTMIHTGEMPFECDECGKRFRQVDKLKIHRITHSNSKPFICDICGKGFRFSNYLSIHRRLHAGDKPFKCKFCDEHFHTLHMRRQHMKILHVETKTYACTLCPEVLTAQCYLTAHLKRHNNQRDFKCERCAKGFYSVAQLKDHQLSHTGAKPFACVLCDARFQRKSNYKQHLKTHSDDKTYVCHICNKAFTQNAGLYAHMKVHKQRPKSDKQTNL